MIQPSQISAEAVQRSVESALELGKFYRSLQNTARAPAMVPKFKREREKEMLLPRLCVRDAARLISAPPVLAWFFLFGFKRRACAERCYA